MSSMLEVIDQNVPLVVDLDGTLIKENSLLKSVQLLLSKKPYLLMEVLFFAAFSTLFGKSRFKAYIAKRVQINPSEFIYRENLLIFLKKQKEMGRRLILATGADESIARSVADFLSLFDEFYGSSKTINLTGGHKLKVILERHSIFDYIGDSRADLKIFFSARKFYIAGNSLNRSYYSKETFAGHFI